MNSDMNVKPHSEFDLLETRFSHLDLEPTLSQALKMSVVYILGLDDPAITSKELQRILFRRGVDLPIDSIFTLSEVQAARALIFYHTCSQLERGQLELVLQVSTLSNELHEKRKILDDRVAISETLFAVLVSKNPHQSFSSLSQEEQDLLTSYQRMSDDFDERRLLSPALRTSLHILLVEHGFRPPRLLPSELEYKLKELGSKLPVASISAGLCTLHQVVGVTAYNLNNFLNNKGSESMIALHTELLATCIAGQLITPRNLSPSNYQKLIHLKDTLNNRFTLKLLDPKLTVPALKTLVAASLGVDDSLTIRELEGLLKLNGLNIELTRMFDS